MQSSKRLLKRLMAIYIVYFLVLAGGFIQQLPDARSSFMKGYNDAYQDDYRSRETGEVLSTHYMDTNLTGKPEQHITSGNTTLDIAYTHAEITMTTHNDTSGHGLGFSFLFQLIAEIAHLTILIMMGVIINSLRRSIRDEQPLLRVNIARTRWIGTLIIGATLLTAFASYINNRVSESLLAGSGIIVDTSFALSYWDLSMGILILFTAEVFAIGHKLGEEQKLTI